MGRSEKVEKERIREFGERGVKERGIIELGKRLVREMVRDRGVRKIGVRGDKRE